MVADGIEAVSLKKGAKWDLCRTELPNKLPATICGHILIALWYPSTDSPLYCLSETLCLSMGCQLFQGYIFRQKVPASPFPGRSYRLWVWCACSISDHTLPLWLLKGFSVIGCSCWMNWAWWRQNCCWNPPTLLAATPPACACASWLCCGTTTPALYWTRTRWLRSSKGKGIFPSPCGRKWLIFWGLVRGRGVSVSFLKGSNFVLEGSVHRICRGQDMLPSKHCCCELRKISM